MKGKSAPWRTAVILIAVGFILAIPLAVHPGSNVWCRLGMAFQIVDNGQLHIEPWRHKTNDSAFANGHAYNDKAPGSAILAVPVYAGIKFAAEKTGFVFKDNQTIYEVSRYLIRITTLLPLCLLAAFMLARFLKSTGTQSHWFGFAWLCGTVAFPFSVLLFGHQYAACLMAMAFAVLYKYKSTEKEKRSVVYLILSAFFIGYSIYTEFPSAIIALFLGLYLLTFERRFFRVLTFGFIGAVLPAAAIMVHNYLCFGSPVSFGYNQLLDPGNLEGMSHGILGVTAPRMDAFLEITLLPKGGLLFSAPWLIFAILGFFVMVFKKGQRIEAFLFVFMIAAYLAFNAGYWEPGGAGSFGPRHLVPVVPFIALLAFKGGLGFGQRTKSVFLAFLGLSVFLTAVGTYSDPTMPDRLLNPLIEFSPAVLGNGLGLGSVLGMTGFIQFVLMLNILLILVLMMWVWPEKSDAKVLDKPPKSKISWRLAWFFVALLLLVIPYLFIFPYTAKTEKGIKHQALGNYYSANKSWELAADSYLRAANTINDPYIHFYRLKALGKLGRVDEMYLEYEKAMELAPDFAEEYLMHWHLGIAYARQGDYGPMTKHLRKVLELKPDFPHRQAVENLLVKGEDV